MRDETTSTQFGILEKAESCGSSRKLKTNLIYTQNPYKLEELAYKVLLEEER